MGLGAGPPLARRAGLESGPLEQYAGGYQRAARAAPARGGKQMADEEKATEQAEKKEGSEGEHKYGYFDPKDFAKGGKLAGATVGKK